MKAPVGLVSRTGLPRKFQASAERVYGPLSSSPLRAPVESIMTALRASNGRTFAVPVKVQRLPVFHFVLLQLVHEYRSSRPFLGKWCRHVLDCGRQPVTFTVVMVQLHRQPQTYRRGTWVLGVARGNKFRTEVSAPNGGGFVAGICAMPPHPRPREIERDVLTGPGARRDRASNGFAVFSG